MNCSSLKCYFGRYFKNNDELMNVLSNSWFFLSIIAIWSALS